MVANVAANPLTKIKLIPFSDGISRYNCSPTMPSQINVAEKNLKICTFSGGNCRHKYLLFFCAFFPRISSIICRKLSTSNTHFSCTGFQYVNKLWLNGWCWFRHKLSANNTHFSCSGFQCVKKLWLNEWSWFLVRE